MASPALEVFFLRHSASRIRPDFEVVVVIEQAGLDHGIAGVRRNREVPYDEGLVRAHLTIWLRDDRAKRDLENAIGLGYIGRITLVHPIMLADQQETDMEEGSYRTLPPETTLQHPTQSDSLSRPPNVETRQAVRNSLAGQAQLWKTSPHASIPVPWRLRLTMTLLEQALKEEMARRRVWEAMRTATKERGKPLRPRLTEARDREMFGLSVPKDLAYIVYYVGELIDLLVEAGVPANSTRPLVLNAYLFVLPVDTVIRDKVKERLIYPEDVRWLLWAYGDRMGRLLDNYSTQEMKDLRKQCYTLRLLEACPGDTCEHLNSVLFLADMVGRQAASMGVPLSKAFDIADEEWKDIGRVDRELMLSEDGSVSRSEDRRLTAAPTQQHTLGERAQKGPWRKGHNGPILSVF